MRLTAHFDLARPSHGEWLGISTNLPGFHPINRRSGRCIYALLPGWSYERREIRAEMIPDHEALAERSVRSNDDASGRAA